MELTEVTEILTAFLTNIISDFYKIIEMLSKSPSPLTGNNLLARVERRE